MVPRPALLAPPPARKKSPTHASSPVVSSSGSSSKWQRLLYGPHVLCEVCFEEQPVSAFFSMGRCSHRLCAECALRYVREALSNRAERLLDGGLPCFAGHARCSTVLYYDQFRALQRFCRRLGCEDPLTDDELGQLERCGIAAGVSSRIQVTKRGDDDDEQECEVIDCPVCELPSFYTTTTTRRGAGGPAKKTTQTHPVPGGKTNDGGGETPNDDDDHVFLSLKASKSSSSSFGGVSARPHHHLQGGVGRTPRARCPQCHVDFCRRCLCRWHFGQSCEEHRRRRRETQDMEALDREYIEATSKPCPTCTFPTSKFHGHGCHHISPGTRGGCVRCSTHWCYACGATADENETKRGRKSRCRCDAGSWSAFCSTVDVRNHLALEPYPHDARCGCLICPTCHPTTGPCAQCDGACAVCLGLVDPVQHHVHAIMIAGTPAWAPPGFRRAIAWVQSCTC
mmetsp:Transcript_17741/g.57434  ORF Transcript_17741/g.57434 Transcript_17741/m.57434 type:complete len:454 (+) Transcript_17741:75-1436(+)